jgi:hypothetical protein
MIGHLTACYQFSLITYANAAQQIVCKCCELFIATNEEFANADCWCQKVSIYLCDEYMRRLFAGYAFSA